MKKIQDITGEEAFAAYNEWMDGKPKSQIEKDRWDNDSSNGKFFTRVCRELLEIETEDNHPLVEAVRALRTQVRELGEEPVA